MRKKKRKKKKHFTCAAPFCLSTPRPCTLRASCTRKKKRKKAYHTTRAAPFCLVLPFHATVSPPRFVILYSLYATQVLCARFYIQRTALLCLVPAPCSHPYMPLYPRHAMSLCCIPVFCTVPRVSMRTACRYIPNILYCHYCIAFHTRYTRFKPSLLCACIVLLPIHGILLSIACYLVCNIRQSVSIT